MPDDSERKLQRFLTEAHQVLDPDAPRFEATLRQARRRRVRRRADRRKRWLVLAPASAALMLLLVLIWQRPNPQPELNADEVNRLAESLRTWHGPTDFLRRTPGASLMETPEIMRRFDLSTSWTTTGSDALFATAEPEKAQ